MSKRYAWFVTALFCAFLGGFALWGVLSPDREFSPDENRYLAQRPGLTGKSLASGSFMSDYETYVTDQFPLRDGWIAGKAWCERLSGKKENNGVYFTTRRGMACLIPRFDPPDEKRLTDNLNYVNRFIENSPIPVTFGLIPTAATVWERLLPEGAPNYDQRLVLDRAAGTVPQFVSLFDALDSNGNTDIYYHTDHHWTSLGAYYGYVGLSGALGYEPLPLPKTYRVVSREFYGTSYSSSGVRWVGPDNIVTYVPDDGVTVTSYTGDKAEPRSLYDYSKLEGKDKYAFFLGGQQPLCVIETGHGGEKLLIVRDSYSDSLAPFLTQNFSQLHLVDLRYYKGSLQDYIRENAIDRALVLYSVPNFVSDGNLAWLTR